MALIDIPPALQKITGGQSSLKIEASSLQDALQAIEAQYPGVWKKIISDTGQIQRYVSIFVGDEDVKYLKGMKTPLDEKSRVSILIAVAGG